MSDPAANFATPRIADGSLFVNGEVPIGQLPGYIIPRLAWRLANAHLAHTAGIPLCLEHGQPALQPSDALLPPDVRT